MRPRWPRLLAATAVPVVLGGCSLSTHIAQAPTSAHPSPADCVGKRGDIVVSSGGVFSISATQRVGIQDISFDAPRPTVTLRLVTGRPAGARAVASVGQHITFGSSGYTVTRICHSHVELDRAP